MIFFILFNISIILSNNYFDKYKNFDEISSNPIISYDHINNSSFYISTSNPYKFNDENIFDISINTSTYIPIGTFNISKFKVKLKSDSTFNNSFNHSRGDYGYYDNTVSIKKNLEDISSIILLHSRSQPRYFLQSSKGITLQNYLINISKKNDKNIINKISTTFLYHKEDLVFSKSSSEFISRFSDSYHLGLSFGIDLNKFKLNANFCNQFTNGNHFNGELLDESNSWINILSSYNINKKNTISFKTIFKQTIHDKLTENSDNNYLDIFFFNKYINGNLLIEVGIQSSNFNNTIKHKPYINIDIKNLFKCITLSYIDFYDNKFGYNQITDLNSISHIQKGVIDYKKDNISIILNPFNLKYDNSEYNLSGLLFKTKLVSNNFKFNVIGGFYDNDNKQKSSINSYLNYESTYALPLKNVRYMPFVSFGGNILKANDEQIDMYFNFLDPSFSYKTINNSFIKFGFILERFKISFTYDNCFDKQNFSFFYNNDYSLGKFYSLEVDWNFLD